MIIVIYLSTALLIYLLNVGLDYYERPLVPDSMSVSNSVCMYVCLTECPVHSSAIVYSSHKPHSLPACFMLCTVHTKYFATDQTTTAAKWLLTTAGVIRN